MTNSEKRFESIRAAYRKVAERRETFRSALREKYGESCPPLPWQTRTERNKADAIQAADMKATERMCSLLDEISPRDWRSGVPAHWLMTDLTFADATTRGALSVVPPCAYGHSAADMRAFASRISVDTGHVHGPTRTDAFFVLPIDVGSPAHVRQYSGNDEIRWSEIIGKQRRDEYGPMDTTTAAVFSILARSADWIDGTELATRAGFLRSDRLAEVIETLSAQLPQYGAEIEATASHPTAYRLVFADPARVNLYRADGVYNVSTDRQQLLGEQFRGQSMIWDDRRNAYVTDAMGQVLTFPSAHDAEQWLTSRAPVIDCSGHHRQEGYECEECGHGSFHYSHEFANGVAGDLTRVCADCTHIDTETAEQFRALRLADVDAITAEIGTSGETQTIALSGDARTDIAAAVGAEHADACESTSCDINRAVEDGYPFWAAQLLWGATECPLLGAVVDHHTQRGLDFQAAADSDRDEWIKSPTWAQHAYRCESCNSITFGDDSWAPDECGNCGADKLTRVSLDGYDVDGFVTGYIETLLWCDCFPADAGNGEEIGETGGCEHLTVSDAVRETLAEDCRSFIADNRADLDAYSEQMGVWHGVDTVRGTNASYNGAEQAGHDFYLTRAGHGAGFWDRGLGDLGKRLTDASKPYGESANLIDAGDGTAELL